MITGNEQLDIVHWNDAIIDYSRSVISKGDQEVELTKNELFILRVLVQSLDKIVSRDELMRKLWDDEKFVNDNTLSVNVNRLRLKLEQIGLEEVIVTKKGLGYIAITKEEL